MHISVPSSSSSVSMSCLFPLCESRFFRRTITITAMIAHTSTIAADITITAKMLIDIVTPSCVLLIVFTALVERLPSSLPKLVFTVLVIGLMSFDDKEDLIIFAPTVDLFVTIFSVCRRTSVTLVEGFKVVDALALKGRQALCKTTLEFGVEDVVRPDDVVVVGGVVFIGAKHSKSPTVEYESAECLSK